MKIKQDVKRIYVIKNKELNRIKIGVSVNAERRLNEIIAHSGCDMEIVYKSKPIYNYFEVEKKLHTLFSEQRLVGEWFIVNEKTVINRAKNLTSKTESCKICKHYNSGKNATEIANILNVSRSGIVRYLKSLGYEKSKDKTLKIIPKKILKTSSSLTPQQIKEMVLRSKS